MSVYPNGSEPIIIFKQTRILDVKYAGHVITLAVSTLGMNIYPVVITLKRCTNTTLSDAERGVIEENCSITT